MKSNLFTIALLIFCMGQASAQIGELDNSFDGDGNLTLTFSQGECVSTSVLVQPDGKIIIGGFEGKQHKYTAIARLHPDGSLDNSFGRNGTLAAFSNALLMDPSYMRAMALQEGKLLVMGSFKKHASDTYGPALVRFTETGQPDSTFGVDGKAAIIYDYPINAQTTTVRPDGKIIVGGRGDNNFTLLCYHPDGRLDGAFKTIKIPIDRFSQGACSIAIRPDGKMVVAVGFGSDLILSRYLPSGHLDKTFGTDGTTTNTLKVAKSLDSYIVSTRVLLEPLSGKITVGLNGGGRYPAGFFWVRYDHRGNLDRSFGINGVINDLKTFMEDAVLQPDKKMVTAESYFGANGLVRYHWDGRVDETFGTNGRANVFFGEDNNKLIPRVLTALSLQQDGGIVVVGGYNKNFAAARFHSGFHIDGEAFRENIALCPNPVVENALLKYTLDTPERVTIRLLDIQGRLLEEFVRDQMQEQGFHQLFINWPVYIPPGMYFLSYASSSKRSCIKIVKN